MKKSLLFVFPMLFAGLLAQAQVYYTQDFESGPPADWTISTQWSLTDAAGIASDFFAPGDHTMFMGFNDDALVNSFDDNGRVTSSPIDLTATTGPVVLTFASYFINGDYQGDDETAKISISTDAGATWTLAYDLQISGDWQEVGTVINYPGQTIWLAFDYDDGGGWNYGWCFDDVTIKQPSVFRDISFLTLNGETLVANGLVGGKVYPGCTIQNNGVETITSIDLTWSVGGVSTTETINGLNIPYGNSALIESPTPYIMAEGTAQITVSIGNINGLGADENPANDAGDSFSVTSTTVHPDKGVLVEEGTGTWCQWCPRGAVFLDLMTNRYPGHFVGIAVHNGDPMVLAAYDNGIAFSAFPDAKINRTSNLDPADIEAPFQSAANLAPPARLKVGAEFNDATRELTVNVGTEFLEDIGSGYKLNAILIEDAVTGTSGDYAQINAYAGGGFGLMGGYEILPGAVPASQMVYDHVGRALLGGFNGVANSLPASATTGQVLGYTFSTYTIPASYDLEHIHLVGVMTNGAGQVVNVISTSLEEAIANGPFVSSTKDVVNNDLISVSPNPFSSVTNVQLNLATSQEVTLMVYDAVGKLVAERSYGELVGAQSLPFDGTNLNSGMYMLHVRIGDSVATKRVYLSK